MCLVHKACLVHDIERRLCAKRSLYLSLSCRYSICLEGHTYSLACRSLGMIVLAYGYYNISEPLVGVEPTKSCLEHRLGIEPSSAICANTKHNVWDYHKTAASPAMLPVHVKRIYLIGIFVFFCACRFLY